MPSDHATIRTRAASGSCRGRAHRSNDDRIVVLDQDVAAVRRARRGQLFAVIDGVGGVRLGGQAADHIAARLPDFFAQAPEQGIVALVEAIDAEVCDFGRARGRRLGAAAATVAWLAPHRRLVTVHAGDTAALRWDGMGLRRLTEDHGTRHGLARYLGMGRAGQLEVREHGFEPGDTLCMISDGVLEVMGVDEVGAALAAGAEPAQCVARLLRELRSRHPPDDASILVAVLDSWSRVG